MASDRRTKKAASAKSREKLNNEGQEFRELVAVDLQSSDSYNAAILTMPRFGPRAATKVASFPSS